jgi:hypothetical protein
MWEPTTAKWVHACVDNRRLYVPLPSLGTAPRHWVIRCLQGIIFKRRHDFSQLWLIVFFGFLVADLGSKGSCKEPAKWVREPRGGGWECNNEQKPPHNNNNNNNNNNLVARELGSCQTEITSFWVETRFLLFLTLINNLGITDFTGFAHLWKILVLICF